MADKILLKDFAKVIRSKNAGPFEVTFDIIFKDRADFNRVKDSGVITEELICKLLTCKKEDIITFMYFDVANAIKITLPRRRKEGAEGETDMHQAQQYIPLMYIEIE